MMNERENELRVREEKLKRDDEKFKQLQQKRAQDKQEELFRIDIERELEKKDKTGETLRKKMVRILCSTDGQMEQEDIDRRLQQIEIKQQ